MQFSTSQSYDQESNNLYKYSQNKRTRCLNMNKTELVNEVATQSDNRSLFSI
jgi:hypothetical protein